MEHCKAHSGMTVAIEILEKKVSDLCFQTREAHERIDSMKSWLVGVLVALVLNLIGIITLLAKALP